MTFDQKTKDSVVWSAVYNAGASAAEIIISNIAFSALLGYSLSVVGGVVNAAVNGAIIVAIVGTGATRYAYVKLLTGKIGKYYPAQQ